jgi:hypothetical protein
LHPNRPGEEPGEEAGERDQQDFEDRGDCRSRPAGEGDLR